ncbi:MAG: ATP-binding cassette domain-containing protein [Pseudomonadota bacterium]
MNVPIIKVKDLRKRYGEQLVLDGVTFDIGRNSVTTIIGRSGGGKSVLLKHLSGLEKPDSGEITYEFPDVACGGSLETRRVIRRLGILFQDGALFDSLTVAENVAFPLREHTNLSDKEIRDIVRTRLTRVGMEAHAEKFPSQISGGMRKRAGLARALALEPCLVFFDEPTSGLDPVTSSSIYELIKTTHRETAVTYVVVSHDIRGAFETSEVIMMLWEGKILEQGSPEQMRRSTNPIVRQFITGSVVGPIRLY